MANKLHTHTHTHIYAAHIYVCVCALALEENYLINNNYFRFLFYLHKISLMLISWGISFFDYELRTETETIHMEVIFPTANFTVMGLPCNKVYVREVVKLKKSP